jgi:hypothetical protein
MVAMNNSRRRSHGVEYADFTVSFADDIRDVRRLRLYAAAAN